ncbi:acyl-CoA synthetase [Hymenobacter sp. PAMC 26628]|uniref:acyl-CoA synthetase n=1 Tax=Hymenobacter sp. PAMC 26628 TaxID=1484118 RepID=UPI0007703B0E|nr:AMP-binding protein [Hymenobacter sp. PAMC 26628]AMJ65599.1 branched-chain amino acid aminotransferase [Hymenobacter sp. PAMC 26628]
MQDYFQHFQRLARAGAYAGLAQWPVPKPEFFNWTAEIFEGLHVAAHPGKAALVLVGDEAGAPAQSFSYGELSGRANRLLNHWRAGGVGPGQAVLLMVPAVAELWLTYLAGIKGGLVLVPVATLLTVPDLVYRFGHLLPAVVVADAENAEKIDRAEQLLGQRIGLKMLVGPAVRPGWVGFGATDDQPAEAAAAATRTDDPLFMFFTSGTTGLPKVVVHTHFSYPVGHLSTAAWIGLRPDDVHCNVAQAGWAKFAWSSFFAPLSVGATLLVHRPAGKFAAGALLRVLAQQGATTFCAPPTVLRLLILEDLTQYAFGFRECVSAGEPLNPEVIDAWQRGTGVLLRDGYGQTESTAMVYNLPGSTVRLGSMGLPSFLYDVVVANDEGVELPALAEGHIAVRMHPERPNGIFKEYFGEPERAATVFRHGLYYTGDKAYRDADGYVWFVGRDDDVIKSSDYRVGPFEVESALVEHPAVVEAAAVGSPHAIKGYEIKAFLLLRPGVEGSPALAAELFAFCREHLAPYKMPRILEFVPELPKTTSGKIRRVELRAQEAQHRRLGAARLHEHFYGKLAPESSPS